MKAIRFFCKLSLLLIATCLFLQPVPVQSAEIKSINAELVSWAPAFSGKDNICIVPIFKFSNPNDKMISASIDYTLSLAGQLIGSAQLPTIYIPAGEIVNQRDSVVIVYRSWFARLYFEGKSPGAALKAILPLWKGMGGKEPAKVPQGMWSKISATKFQIIAEGSITVGTPDGTEKIFFFKTPSQ